MIKNWLLIIISFLGWSFYPGYSQAQTSTFSVSPIYPSNQNQQVNGYFDLNVDQTDNMQTVQIRIKNNLDDILSLGVFAANAFNTSNGDILLKETDDTENSHIIDPKYKMKDYLKTPRVITIQPHKEELVPIEIHIPQEITGSILGGVIIKEISETSDTGKIEQDISYGISIQLNYPTVDQPTFKFTGAEITKSPSGSILNFELENQSASIVKNASLTYTIKDNQNKIVFSGKLSNIKMSPKTTMKYPITWGAKELKNETHHLEVTTEFDGQQTTNNTQELPVLPSWFPENESTMIGNEDRNAETKNKLIFILCSTFVGTIVLIIFTVFFVKRKKANPKH